MQHYQLWVAKFNFDSFDWSCPNRFVWPELNGVNDPDYQWRSGYYNGLDYMVLHNLYWLTKVNASESVATYMNYIIENQVKDISSESEHVFARYSVKFQSGFKVTGNSSYKFIAGVVPDMRTTYDSDLPFTYQYNDYCVECDPIFKEDNLKSASIATGVKDNTLGKTNISIFPNPTKGNLTVLCNEILQCITVLNSSGKIQVEYTDLDTTSYTFSLSSFPLGIYMIKTTTQNGYEKIEKLLKKE
ncbi:MAG: T9SS type A sorting domain-containing protein [Prolixibacteraceae bacterium]|jgi:hypothetical protein|nr:T9SS type A sorting domain-containing protein [Prolixibacteraceae bacterium]